MVIAVPTVTRREDGTLQKVAWTYRLAAGGALDPLALIDGALKFAITGAGSHCAEQMPDRVYNDAPIDTADSPTIVEHELTCTTLPRTAVEKIGMA